MKIVIIGEVILYPGEDNFWVAECPSLPGCISQGETKEQAITNIKEAFELFIETLREDNLPAPEAKYNSFVVAV